MFNLVSRNSNQRSIKYSHFGYCRKSPRKTISHFILVSDLEKAFDKISRYKLLKKLVKMGISNVMLQALKRLYLGTYCILTFGSEFSKQFRTYCGVRQGAASSALLFIGFIDDLVDYLEERCPPEPLLDILHCLLHADDTAILREGRCKKNGDIIRQSISAVM